jgi:hypothetical protein
MRRNVRTDAVHAMAVTCPGRRVMTVTRHDQDRLSPDVLEPTVLEHNRR